MIIQGDCIDEMMKLPDESVHCCVCSPPYYGLRDYGFEGQIGLEKTPEEYVQKLVEVFREVRRVLRKDGTLWLNVGDSYATSSKHGSGGCGVSCLPYAKNQRRAGNGGMPPKNLLGIPWRVAFALQNDGWYLRQDIIWHKPNAMPESVKDRCTKSHEYVFLLTKNRRYFYDNEAVKEPASIEYATRGRRRNPDKVLGGGFEIRGGLHLQDGSTTRNRRDVWTIATRPYKGAHFATMPPDLVEICINAGCPKGGTVLDPFAGSGTTGAVAKSLGHDYILIEANNDYHKLINERLALVKSPSKTLGDY